MEARRGELTNDKYPELNWEEPALPPGMTEEEFRNKVRAFLKNHPNIDKDGLLRAETAEEAQEKFWGPLHEELYGGWPNFFAGLEPGLRRLARTVDEIMRS